MLARKAAAKIVCRVKPRSPRRRVGRGREFGETCPVQKVLGSQIFDGRLDDRARPLGRCAQGL